MVGEKCYTNLSSLTTYSEAIHAYLISCTENILSTRQLLKNSKKMLTKLLSALELVLLSLGFAEDKYLGRKQILRVNKTITTNNKYYVYFLFSIVVALLFKNSTGKEILLLLPLPLLTSSTMLQLLLLILLLSPLLQSLPWLTKRVLSKRYQIATVYFIAIMGRMLMYQILINRG